ncbi:MAG TPA: efflux RND transporter periplasmic adaptor subunit [Verrucomicrobiae bacterium]|jgi:RND family efflux transporter MFP subunit|nr:efflux RND transporter periplasmic adaptor subunit [Verrucomicrobiae bacterium]
MSKKVFALVLLAIAAVAGIYIYRSSRPVVEVFLARRGTATYAVYGTVKVVPMVSFSIHARSGGVLKMSEALAYATNLIGMEITNGQYLGEVVSESLDRDFAKASAEWEAAQARQKLGPAGLPMLKTQESLVERFQKLAAQNNIAPSDVERATNDLATLRDAVHQQQIELDRSTEVFHQAYEDQKERKERCKFISLIDGVINAVNNANGEFIPEGSTPFVLETKATYIEGQVNEEDVGHVAPNMKAAVKLYAYPDRELPATVAQVLPTANNQRYTVNLNLDKPPDNLLPGETGEMNIICGTRDNALLIPSRALLADRVWVVRDGVAAPREVKVGYRNIERAEILDGLHDGEAVVVADQDLLRSGMRVRQVVLNPPD